MFCKKCGEKLISSSKYCSKCGEKISLSNNKNDNIIEKSTIGRKKEYNKSAVVGLILSGISIFGIGLAGIAGFVLGIVALVQIKNTHEKGRGIAITAIIIGFIWSFVVGILKQVI